MEVLGAKRVSQKKAAKILRTFIEGHQGENSEIFTMSEEVKFQLGKLLANLEGHEPEEEQAKATEEVEEE